MAAHLRDERPDLRALEGDGRALRVVLVVGVGVERRRDHGVVVGGQARQPLEGELALGREPLAGVRPSRHHGARVRQRRAARRISGIVGPRPYPHGVTTSPKAPPPGLTVGGYALRARLGEGGMGVVHLGQKPGERPVAIKVLRPHVVGDDEARHRLAREVSSLTRVRSRRIAEIVDADPWGEIPYVATRYVPGLSLHDHVQEEGPLAGDDLLWFADCLAEALEAVHDVGVLHRDIKPSNVIMEGRTPILIDFGLARVADDSRITMTGWLLGTPGYLAPEILYGDDATAASDVHAWAATVAYAGTGRAPFGRGPSVAIMDRVRRGEHDLSGLDPVMLPLVEEALAPAAADRPSLDEVRDWLEDLGDRSDEGRPGPVTRPRQPDDAALWWPSMRDDLDAPTRVGTGAPPSHPCTGRTTGTAVDLRRRPHAGVGRPGTIPQRHTRVAAGRDRGVRLGRLRPAVRERVPPGERLRRSLTLLAVGGVVTGGIAFAPYLALTALFFAVWLLRSGSMAAASAGNRRNRRGIKWYDGIQLLLAAPWHVVAGLGGTLLLLLWSLGIGAAFALLCFAASVSLPTSLAVVGASFAIGLWWGPGSERFRSPIHRAVDPLARRGVPWLLVTLLVAAGGVGPRRRGVGAGHELGARRLGAVRRTCACPAGCERVAGAHQPEGASGQAAQAPHGRRRPRPDGRAVARPEGGLGRVRLLPAQPVGSSSATACCPSRAAGATRSPTSCPPVGRATPASATTRSPAGCGASGSTSAPSCCARSRSGP